MVEPQQFQLEVSVEVREVSTLDGYRQVSNYNRLSVRHTIELGALDFLELAQVLGRFHELGETIRKERKNDG